MIYKIINKTHINTHKHTKEKKAMFTRLIQMINAKINALLGRVEKPEEMMPYYLSKLENESDTIKMDTAGVVAQAKGVKRKIDATKEEIQKMDSYARRAISMGKEDDAKRFLTHKEQLMIKLQSLEQNYELQCDNAGRMLEMTEKVEHDVRQLKDRQELIQGSKITADTQMKVNGIIAKANSTNGYVAKFEAQEAKLMNYVDTADALTAIDAAKMRNSISQLTHAYDACYTSDKVSAEIASLKAEIGMESDKLTIEDPGSNKTAG